MAAKSILSLEFIAKALESSPIRVVDVGAAGGIDVGIPFPRQTKYFESFGFEPHPRSFANLRQEARSRYFQMALSDREEEAILFDSGTNSALRPRQGGAEPQFSVQVSTLENCLKSGQVSGIDVLKTDAEGHDLKILRGLGSSGLSSLLYVKSEFSFHGHAGCEDNCFSNLDVLLRERGFFFYRMVSNVGMIGELCSGDVVYLRRMDRLVADAPPSEARNRLIKLMVTCSYLLAFQYGYIVAKFGHERGLFTDSELNELEEIFSQKVFLPRVLRARRFLVPFSHVFFMLGQLLVGSNYRAKSFPRDNRIRDYRRLFVSAKGLFRKKSRQDLEIARAGFLEKYSD